MKRNPRVAAWLTLAGLSFLGSFSPLSAGEPTDQIRQAADKGIRILADPSLKSEEKRKERIDRLREIANTLFDFTEMAKRSLGPHWHRLTPAEQKEFTNVFREFLEKVYAGKIDYYNGEEAIFTREVVDKNYAEVYSKLVNQKGDGYSVNYKLYRADGDWKVYDVVFENISVINNYRSQFHRIMTRSSFQELIQMIKKGPG